MRFRLLSVAWGNDINDWCRKVTNLFHRMVEVAGLAGAIINVFDFVLSEMFGLIGRPIFCLNPQPQ